MNARVAGRSGRGVALLPPASPSPCARRCPPRSPPPPRPRRWRAKRRCGSSPRGRCRGASPSPTAATAAAAGSTGGRTAARFDVSLSAPVTRQSWRLVGDAGAARLEGLEGGTARGSGRRDAAARGDRLGHSGGGAGRLGPRRARAGRRPAMRQLRRSTAACTDRAGRAGPSTTTGRSPGARHGAPGCVDADPARPALDARRGDGQRSPDRRPVGGRRSVNDGPG